MENSSSKFDPEMHKIRFLGTAGEIAAQSRELLRLHRSNEPIRIAVAFWGKGAQDFIGATAKQYRIICNLKSGGTNPDVVRSVAARANVSIRQLDTLHAKVLISDNGALVSSSNFSTNGLALEGVNSQTWKEAGVLLPVAAGEHSAIIDWFEQIWMSARSIGESDLEAADRAWMQGQTVVNSAVESDSEIAHGANDDLRLLRTVEFPKRAPMKQVYLRSAASFIALNGYAGEAMPASAFIFLFTARAFSHHKSKFKGEDGKLKLRENFVGHFIGQDGSIETAQSGRLKSFSDEIVHAVARWMLGEGPRPVQLEGSVVEARFSRYSGR